MKRDLFRKASRAMLLTATLLLSAWWPNHAKAQVQPPEIGYILCTDNTVVSPDDYATSGKTAKAVIFYVDPLNTTQGLAVALKDANIEPIMFSSQTSPDNVVLTAAYQINSEAMRTKNGRSCTQKLRAYSYTQEAACSITNERYNEGWFLPSLGELRALASHTGRVKYALEAIKSVAPKMAEPMKGTWYWSSTEYSSSNAWRCSGAGAGNPHTKKGKCNVRPIIAFSLPGAPAPQYKVADKIDFGDGSNGVVFFTESGGKQGWAVATNNSPKAVWSNPANEALTSSLNLDATAQYGNQFENDWESCAAVINMESGRKNTRIIRELGTAAQYPAVYSVRDAAKGWYLPSAGQLHALGGVLWFNSSGSVNQSMIGSEPLDMNTTDMNYWLSSTPFNSEYVWVFGWGYNTLHSIKKSVNYLVRGVRSFGYPTLTLTDVPNGKVEATPDTDIPEKQWVTVIPTSNPGCALKSIKAFKTGEESTTLTITANRFRMPMHDVTIAAEFVAGAGKNITIANGITNGSITTDITSNIAENAEVTLMVTPAPGYRIKAGSLKATDTSNPSTGLAITGNSFLMPDFHVTLTAEFEVFAYNIAIDPNTVNGTVVAEPGQDIQPGTEVTLTPQPAAGYQYKAGSLKVCRTSNPAIIITPSAEGKITMPSYDLTVSAEFEALTYAVAIATSIEHGTLSASPNGNVATGTEIAVTATPAAGYQLKEGSLKAYKTDEPSVEIAINGGLFSMPAYNATITAEFEVATPTTYTVLIGDLEYGDITATPSANVATGTEVTLTATPAAGYRLKAGSLKAFKPDDQSVTVTITNNKFTMPAYNVLVKGEFELNTGIETPASAALTLYPNPANNNVYINGITSATQVDIYSIVGALTLSTQIEPNQPISLNGLKAGVYLVKVNGQTLRLVKK